MTQAARVEYDLEIALDTRTDGQLFLGRGRGILGERGVDGLGEQARGGVQLEASRLDVGELQDVVDELQQPSAAGMDGFREFTTFAFGQLRRAADDFREADDGVQRRAQLMRHVGQKLGFHPIGFLEFEVGALQHLDRLALPLEPAGIVERNRRLIGQDLEDLHQRRVEQPNFMKVDRDRPHELALEEHRKAERRPPTVLLAQWIERKAPVELNVLGKDRALLDDDLRDEARSGVGERFPDDARVDPVPHLDHLIRGRARSGQRDQARRRARDAEHRARHALQQRVRANGHGGQCLRDLAQHLHRGVEPKRLLPRLFEEEGVLEGDGNLGPEGSSQLDVIVAAEGAIPLVG